MSLSFEAHEARCLLGERQTELSTIWVFSRVHFPGEKIFRIEKRPGSKRNPCGIEPFRKQLAVDSGFHLWISRN